MSHLDLLQFHAFCLTRTGTRLDQYARAIAGTVREGDTVLDLGTGTGVLAVLACRAGARRVHAVESSDAVRMGELLSSATGLADRIQFIQGSSSQLVLDERVDVVVGDIHDTFGLQPGGLASLIDARRRLLRPGGVVIPRSIELRIAPVEAADFYAREVDVWTQYVHGVDLGAVRPFAVSHVHAGRFNEDDLLCPTVRLAVIDLEHSATAHVSGTARAVIARDGVVHGLCGCFVTTLAEDIQMGNVPGDSATTNFAQAFLPLERPTPVSAGDSIAITVESYDAHVVRWRAEFSRAGEQPHARFDHSTLNGLLLSPAAMQRQANEYRPALTPRGSMERALLERFDGSATASELQRWLQERFRDLVATDQEAESFLKATIERCG
jgi:protein arginine N-methyltransferase 1